MATRFIAYGWNVLRVGDANDTEMLDRAFTTFLRTSDRPTLIIVDSHIAWGAPNKQDTHAAHGEPLGEDEIRLTKRNYRWPEDAKFLIPEGVYEHMAQGMGERGHKLREEWMTRFEAYRQQYPELADHVYRMQHRQLPDDWDKELPTFAADKKGIAGRDASSKALNAIAKNVPWLIGGAADLAPSTKTRLSFAKDSADHEPSDFTAKDSAGRNLHFGVREHAMSAILNGMSLCKLRPYGAGFLIFSDYGRPAIRLSSIMEIPTLHIFTHDSIGVGEDGPTHQPIEHLASLRAIPGLYTIRPGDANEVVEAWRFVMHLRHEPAALILSRQAMPVLDRSRYAPASGLQRGGYVLADAPNQAPQLILIASGSEVSLAIDAYERLSSEGIAVRVVSLPCWELFEHQTAEYRESVLPAAVTARISIEQAGTFGWRRYIGDRGYAVGMKTFGASAPLKELQKKFGFTADEIIALAKRLLA